MSENGYEKTVVTVWERKAQRTARKGENKIGTRRIRNKLWVQVRVLRSDDSARV